MANYAAYCAKPILERESLIGSVVEDIFPKNVNSVKITFTDLEDYYKEANKLIKDKEYRIWKGNILSNAIITPDEFNLELRYLINNHKNRSINNSKRIDINKLCTCSIETENDYLHMYSRIMLNKVLLRKSIIFFVFSFIIYLRYHGTKKILRKVNNSIKSFIKSKLYKVS